MLRVSLTARTRKRTALPAPSGRRATAAPTKPVAPVMRTSPIVCDSPHCRRALLAAILEPISMVVLGGEDTLRPAALQGDPFMLKPLRRAADIMRLMPQGGPSVCNIAVTNLCNATCDFCSFAYDK